jgi:predicted sulfurtransferase
MPMSSGGVLRYSILIEALDKEKPVMVYCKSGGRSARAASILKDKGFENVYDLDGGIIGWEEDLSTEIMSRMTFYGPIPAPSNSPYKLYGDENAEE